MKSSKCVACGFVGSSEIEHCKACGAQMNLTTDGLAAPADLTGDETTVQGFEAIGVPASYRSTGTRSFFVDETFIIR
jgi:hypothetical protein